MDAVQFFGKFPRGFIRPDYPDFLPIVWATWGVSRFLSVRTLIVMRTLKERSLSWRGRLERGNEGICVFVGGVPWLPAGERSQVHKSAMKNVLYI